MLAAAPQQLLEMQLREQRWQGRLRQRRAAAKPLQRQLVCWLLHQPLCTECWLGMPYQAIKNSTISSAGSDLTDGRLPVGGACLHRLYAAL